MVSVVDYGISEYGNVMELKMYFRTTCLRKNYPNTNIILIQFFHVTFLK